MLRRRVLGDRILKLVDVGGLETLAPPWEPIKYSNAITKGFQKPYGMALYLVYRVENRCKSKGAPAWAFPTPPGAGLGRQAAPNRRFTVLPSLPQQKNIKTLLTAKEDT